MFFFVTTFRSKLRKKFFFFLNFGAVKKKFINGNVKRTPFVIISRLYFNQSYIIFI